MPIPSPPVHRSERLADVLDLSACLIALGLIALVYGGWLGLPRILLALGFAFFVPGRAIVTNWPRMARWSELAIPMVLSLAVLTLLATTALSGDVWHPLDLFQLEAWLSLAALAVGMARRRRNRPGLAAPRPESWSRTGT